ncbi:MAG TPA: cytochrome ubiquinol oxidase subunit I [Bacteroidetes bacterium]|nr:cytochrome ubiquinol oxidase subunit I [Bacteroidota bacterium]
MIENLDMSLVDWSRGQFALTAMFHWLFVPLTLGLSFILAFMETIYVKTGDEFWKRTTKFWMTIFGINFAIGVATGIILEFEFGTNWSNYSWFVGDIFGAPLAIEGIMAFFLESTFIAVMFFGWNKVGKKFHLLSTWLVAIGANLSALWILVANAWMQNPVGMFFNPETARNEMVNFWEVLFSQSAVNKFLHTISSGFVLGALVVIGISSWYLLKRREQLMAKRSMIVASVFGLLSGLFLIFTGDSSARDIARDQPMKFAAMEALYEGKTRAPLVLAGALRGEEAGSGLGEREFLFRIEVPGVLSYMVHLDPAGFVPGILDLVRGNEEHGVLSLEEKISRGTVAMEALRELKDIRDTDSERYSELLARFSDEEWVENHFRYFGYGYFRGKDPATVIPHVPIAFYSFHLMVFLGGFFVLVFLATLYWGIRDQMDNKRWFLRIALWTIPLAYIASQAGWVLSEMGRQPWVIQDLMPTFAAVSRIDTETVQITFWLFAVTFTALLIAELSIMFKQVKSGPKEGEK